MTGAGHAGRTRCVRAPGRATVAGVLRPSSRFRRRARELFAVLLGLIVFVPRVSAHVHLTFEVHHHPHGHQHVHVQDHGHGDHAPHPAEDHLEAAPDLLLLEMPDEVPVVWLVGPGPAPIDAPPVRATLPAVATDPRPPPPRRGAPPRAPPATS